MWKDIRYLSKLTLALFIIQIGKAFCIKNEVPNFDFKSRTYTSSPFNSKRPWARETEISWVKILLKIVEIHVIMFVGKMCEGSWSGIRMWCIEDLFKNL